MVLLRKFLYTIRKPKGGSKRTYMKKAIVVLSIFLFPVLTGMAYAAETDEKCPGKTAFEEKAKTSEAQVIIQDILFQLADPFQEMSDEQATPLAACYVTYNVAGTPLAQFVREQAKVFEAKFTFREAASMRNFAGRIEALHEKAALDVAAGTMQKQALNHVLERIVKSFESLSDKEAAPKAAAYMSWSVNGQPFVEFVEDFAQNFTMDVESRLNSFTSRVKVLAK